VSNSVSTLMALQPAQDALEQSSWLRRPHALSVLGSQAATTGCSQLGYDPRLYTACLDGTHRAAFEDQRPESLKSRFI
jgi:hypothetical protein